MIWRVDPVWFHVGSVPVRYYTVLFVLGLGLGVVACHRHFVRRGYPVAHVRRLAVWVTVSLVVGAHLAHLLFYEPESFTTQPRRIMELGEGLASHGGVVAALAALVLFCRHHGVPWLRYADPIAVSALWLGVTVRVGNFFNSELVGRPSDVPWAVVFAHAGLDEPRHPSQLYEAAISAALLACMGRWYRTAALRWPDGATCALTMWLYFVTRFAVEYVKDFDAVTATPALTMGQVLSVPFVVASSAWLASMWKRTRGR
jgi:phosphatidylglycerol:prolipoprotein diacylglycerol transferase